MKKNLQILSMLGLLLSVGNSYTLSKTYLGVTEVYVPTTERDDLGLRVGDFYKYDYFNEMDKINKTYEAKIENAKVADKKKLEQEQTAALEKLKQSSKVDELTTLNKVTTIMISDKNFEIFNKSKGPITIALQYIEPNAQSGPLLKINPNSTADKYTQVINPGKENQFQYTDVLPIYPANKDAKLRLYIWDKSVKVEKEESTVDWAKKGLINLGAKLIGDEYKKPTSYKIKNPQYIYEFRDLYTLNRFNMIEPVANKDKKPILTLLLTWDGKEKNPLRPETGQLGPLQSLGIPKKTESGLSSEFNLEAKNIVQVTAK